MLSRSKNKKQKNKLIFPFSLINLFVWIEFYRLNHIFQIIVCSTFSYAHPGKYCIFFNWTFWEYLIFWSSLGLLTKNRTCLAALQYLFIFIMILIRKKHQKDTTSIVQGGPFHCEKNKFQGLGRSYRYLWCGSWKSEGYLYVAEKMDGGSEFQSLEVRDKQIGECACLLSI